MVSAGGQQLHPEFDRYARAAHDRLLGHSYYLPPAITGSTMQDGISGVL